MPGEINCPQTFTKMSEDRCMLDHSLAKQYLQEINFRLASFPDPKSAEHQKLQAFQMEVTQPPLSCSAWANIQNNHVLNAADQCTATFVQNKIAAKDKVMTTNTCNNFEECMNLVSCVRMGGHNIPSLNLQCDQYNNIQDLQNASQWPCLHGKHPVPNPNC
jgi:hypothetical protein